MSEAIDDWREVFKGTLKDDARFSILHSKTRKKFDVVYERDGRKLARAVNEFEQVRKFDLYDEDIGLLETVEVLSMLDKKIPRGVAL